MDSLAIAFGLYSIAIVGLGLAAARTKDRSDDDFFLAGRSLGPWLAALSASASSSSGWTTIGLVGFAFVNGAMAYWIIPGVLFGFIFNWVVIAPRLHDRATEIEARTVPDLFAFHFRERLPILRLTSVVVIMVAMFLYVAAQFAAAGLAFEAAFERVDFNIGVAIGAAYVLTYSVAGGFRASVWTDAAQFVVMMITLAGLPLYLVLFHTSAGEVRASLAGVGARARLAVILAQAGRALVGFLLGSGALGINLGYPGQPHVLVRFMAMRDRRYARVGLPVSIVWAVLTVGGAVSIGLIVRAMVVDATVFTPEQNAGLTGSGGQYALIIASKDLLPGLLAGVMLAGVLSAICSTVDSQLIVAASSVSSDVYSRLIQRDERATHAWINRVVVFGLGVGAAVLVVVDQTTKVYEYVLSYGWAVLGASFGPQLILLLTWRRATYAGCIAGMGTGFVVAIGWKLGEGAIQEAAPGLASVATYNLTVAFVAALVVNVLVSLATRAPGDGDRSKA